MGKFGGIMEGWKKEKLGNLLELVYGKSLPKTKRTDGNIPVYGSNGIVGFHCEAIVNEPGIIVVTETTVRITEQA